MVPLAIAAALSASSWLAVETGEDQDERVERIVPEQAMEAHEEAAETFLTASIVVLVVTAGGLLRGRIGKASRIVAGIGAVALVAGGAYVGHTGGKLVYQYGAASAYASPASSPNAIDQVGRVSTQTGMNQNAPAEGGD
jgi:hypothetical protein